MPIAMIALPAPWAIRFAMLFIVRKVSDSEANTITSTSRPSSAGSEPSCPALSREK